MRAFRIILLVLLTLTPFSIYAEEAPAADQSAKPAEAPAFTLTTIAFMDKGMVPVLYTCDGKDISLALEWTNVPAKTKALALIISDPDAPQGTFYHWILYNIPATAKSLAEGEQKLPAGTMVGINSAGKKQYTGPCPPKGTTHNYIFKLYALDAKLTLPDGADAKTVLSAMDKHTLGTAELTAVYSRWLT